MADASEFAPRNLRDDPDGFLKISKLIPVQECDALARNLPRDSGKARDWVKGCAAGSRHFHDLALDYRIVEPLSRALGTINVLLWGASLVRRDPGQAHPWHSDIESCPPDAHTVSVWIGLRNTMAETSLTLVPGSHRLGKSVQELAARDGIERERIDDAMVSAWSRELGRPACEAGPVTLVEMSDGDALLFDGRIWHRSLNLDSDRPRIAVLLQYTAAEAPVRMPDFRHLGWPFRFLEHPQVPCIPVSGDREKVRASPNRIVSPPLLFGAEEGRRLSSSVREFSLPLVDPAHSGLSSFAIFRGYTHHLADFSCHLSVLGRGDCPHPPHRHPEEEVLLILSGEAEIHLPSLECEEQKQILRRGEFVYYPAGHWHTLTGKSREPVHYVMLKWFGDRTHESPPLPQAIFDTYDPEARELGEANGFKPALLFEGATDILSKFHCHRSVLEPGAGYDAHPDEYDVVLMILEGEVETLGKRVGAFGVIYYAAGEPHGIFNPTDHPARYLVFELHGSLGTRLRIPDRPPAEIPFVPSETAPPRALEPRATVPPESSSHRESTDQGDGEREREILEQLEARIRRFEKRMDRRWKKLEGRIPKPRHRLHFRERFFSWERWKMRLRRWSKFQSKSAAQGATQDHPDEHGT